MASLIYLNLQLKQLASHRAFSASAGQMVPQPWICFKKGNFLLLRNPQSPDWKS